MFSVPAMSTVGQDLKTQSQQSISGAKNFWTKLCRHDPEHRHQTRRDHQNFQKTKLPGEQVSYFFRVQ
jgi:hypothetical protein